MIIIIINFKQWKITSCQVSVHQTFICNLLLEYAWKLCINVRDINKVGNGYKIIHLECVKHQCVTHGGTDPDHELARFTFNILSQADVSTGQLSRNKTKWFKVSCHLCLLLLVWFVCSRLQDSRSGKIEKEYAKMKRSVSHSVSTHVTVAFAFPLYWEPGTGYCPIYQLKGIGQSL